MSSAEPDETLELLVGVLGKLKGDSWYCCALYLSRKKTLSRAWRLAGIVFRIPEGTMKTVAVYVC